MKKGIVGISALAIAIAVGIWWQWDGKGGGSSATDNASRDASVVSKEATAVADGGRPVQGGGGVKEFRGEDYLMELHRFKNAAEQGDAAAQLQLSEIYERCIGYAAAPDKYLKGIESLAGADENQKAAISSLVKRISDQCRAVSSAGQFSGRDYQEWLMTAAQAGSLTANARLMTRSSDAPSPDNAKRVADMAIVGKDARALFETGELMARVQDSGALGVYQTVSGAGVGTYAWGVVACRMGLDCGATSPIMDALCINTGKCSYSSYEQFVRGEFVPSGQQGRLDQSIELIGNKLNSSVR